MTAEKPQHAWAAIAAVTVLNLPLGSVYAFSVFLKPIEAGLGINRSAMSLVFALASVGFTVGMLAVPALFGRVSAVWLVGLCGASAVVGVALSAAANGLGLLLLGYSALFGAGGGAVYILAQQVANMLVTRHKGLINGYIVSLYPAGAMISAPLFGWVNAAFGYRTTLLSLAFVLALSTGAAILLLRYARTELPRHRADSVAADGRTAIFVRMWIVFFIAATAGLTVLSQAAGIVAAYGGSTALALAATTGITGAIAVARLSGGWLTDHLQVPFVAAFAQAFALAGAILLTLFPTPAVAAVALGMVGMGHGFISGATAGGIAAYWPPEVYGRISSRLYVAWCVAAVTLPILAGYLYDLTHGYGTTIVIAGCGNLIGVVVALGLPRSRA